MTCPGSLWGCWVRTLHALFWDPVWGDVSYKLGCLNKRSWNCTFWKPLKLVLGSLFFILFFFYCPIYFWNMRFRRHWYVELDPPLMTSQTPRLFSSVCMWFWTYFCGWIIFCELVAFFFKFTICYPSRQGLVWQSSTKAFGWAQKVVSGWHVRLVFPGASKTKKQPNSPWVLLELFLWFEILDTVAPCVMHPIPDCTSLNQKNEHRHSAAAFGQDFDRLSGLEKLDASFHYVSKSVILRIIQDRNG